MLSWHAPSHFNHSAVRIGADSWAIAGHAYCSWSGVMIQLTIRLRTSVIVSMFLIVAPANLAFAQQSTSSDPIVAPPPTATRSGKTTVEQRELEEVDPKDTKAAGSSTRGTIAPDLSNRLARSNRNHQSFASVWHHCRVEASRGRHFRFDASRRGAHRVRQGSSLQRPGKVSQLHIRLPTIQSGARRCAGEGKRLHDEPTKRFLRGSRRDATGCCHAHRRVTAVVAESRCCRMVHWRQQHRCHLSATRLESWPVGRRRVGLSCRWQCRRVRHEANGASQSRETFDPAHVSPVAGITSASFAA